MNKKTLRKLTKKITASLAVLSLTSALLFTGPVVKAACAQSAPVMTVDMKAADTAVGSWQDSLSVPAGRRVQFNVEIHNTVIGSVANNVRAQVTFPGGTSTTISIPVTITTNNAGAVSDTVNISVPSAQSITYVPGSTRLFWDQNGDGTLDYDNAQLADGIVGSSIPLGDQQGCNNFIIRVNFLADISGTPAPTPTPTPTPAPVGGQTQTQSQTQNNNQNVTINNPAAAAAAAPVKTVAAKTTPATGPGELALAGMLGAGPVGFALSRYGRGLKVIGKREEEDLMDIAQSLFSERKNRIGSA
ncbi:MAG: hypothetical protein WD988_00295 [Candidatus Curtissbacteria bacterium]